jgi:hypothetical protein
MSILYMSCMKFLTNRFVENFCPLKNSLSIGSKRFFGKDLFYFWVVWLCIKYLSIWKCFELIKKNIFTWRKMVYPFHLHKLFFFTLSHLRASNYENASVWGLSARKSLRWSQHLPEQVSPTKVLSHLHSQITSNMCRQLY